MDRDKGKGNFAFHPQYKRRLPEFIKLIYYHFGFLLSSESIGIECLNLLVQGLPLNKSKRHQSAKIMRSVPVFVSA